MILFTFYKKRFDVFFVFLLLKDWRYGTIVSILSQKRRPYQFPSGLIKMQTTRRSAIPLRVHQIWDAIGRFSGNHIMDYEKLVEVVASMHKIPQGIYFIIIFLYNIWID